MNPKRGCTTKWTKIQFNEDIMTDKPTNKIWSEQIRPRGFHNLGICCEMRASRWSRRKSQAMPSEQTFPILVPVPAVIEMKK
jgi:hypothetical protein